MFFYTYTCASITALEKLFIRVDERVRHVVSDLESSIRSSVSFEWNQSYKSYKHSIKTFLSR